MARDVEGTKRRAREAAIVEFAEGGRHGTTMERIAARAGVNKERIYSYYGDKAALFDTVVREEVEKVAAAVPLSIERLEDVGEFAGRSFDYLETHPELARLMLWEGLADTGADVEEPSRRILYEEKVTAVAAAQRQGVIDGSVEPADLIFMLLALVGWWSASPRLARLLTGADPGDSAERARRRTVVVAAAIRLARPQP